MTLGLFEGVGVELEYMIVDAETLDVRPNSDRIIALELGTIDAGVVRGPMGWSNELVLHVIEIKTYGPAPSLAGLGPRFHDEVRRINQIAATIGARLLPTGAHPWMNPAAETRLWPHEFNAVFAAYDRIFDCRGHGWSNLQSLHVNLPFDGDDQFVRLHAAVRLVLPILPALCASSPFLDGRRTSDLDARLRCYLTNQITIPSVNGPIVPEPVASRAEYEKRILEPMYQDIAPHDPEGILQYEWLNSRGAIARFDRNAIEIRLMDAQECPSADIAVATLVVETIRALVEERYAPLSELLAWPTEPLREQLFEGVRDADRANVTDAAYCDLWGVAGAISAVELWRRIADDLSEKPALEAVRPLLDTIFNEGCLARRIVRATGLDPDLSRLREVYRRLADCLASDAMFHVG